MAIVDPQRIVAEFHAGFGPPVLNGPIRDSAPERVAMRADLIEEEAAETLAALRAEALDLVEVADGLADLVYVAYGCALELGIDLSAVLAEVHRSNMTKLGSDGRPVLRADGKVLKGPQFDPPQIDQVLGLGGEFAGVLRGGPSRPDEGAAHQ